MKKRLKLITSIMLCCLSLVSLCFGVWAAVSVSLNISGTISYEINEVFVKIQTNLYRSKNVAPLTDDELSTDIASFSTETISEEVELVDGFEVADVITYSPTEGIKNFGETITSEVKNLALKYGAYSADEATTGYAFYLVFSITNYATGAINVQITNNSDAEFLEVNNVTGLSPSVINGRGDAESITSAKVVSMSPADFTTGFESMQFNFSIAINNGVLSGVVIENTASQYYYMYMGSYNGTLVEWRLLSTDGGATRYSYTAGQADSITGDCVFVQNTYTTSSAFNNESRYKQATSDDATNYPGIVSGDSYLLDNNGAFIELSDNGDGTKQYVIANNYEYSEIREYVTGDMVTELGLTNDKTYAKISANADVHNDKLWLLSDIEANNLFTNSTDRMFYSGTSPQYWWLRSLTNAYSYYSGWVTQGGTVIYTSLSQSHGVRAAFKIAL